MCSRKKRLRTCLPIAILIMKFTSRMTRRLLTATSTHSLAQSSVSFANSSMTCLARGSSNCLNHQVVHQSSLLRRRMAPCDSVWTSETSTRSHRRISTNSTCYQPPWPTRQHKALHQAQPPCWLLKCSCHSGPQVEDSLLNVLWLLWVPGHAHGT